MGAFVVYSFVSGLALLGGYLIYKWLLSTENQPRFNRAILLGIYAMSLVVWPLMKAGEPHAAQGLVEALPVAIEGVVPSVEGPSRPLWPAVVLVVYYIGLAAVLVSTFVTAFRLVRIIASGKRIDKDGYTLVLLERDGVAPFSWGRYMVMSRADYSEAAGMIECHEKAHIRAGHFVDLLLAQAVCAVMWYNPASWLMLAELKAVHEYEADERVLASGVDAREYQLLLIKKAVGVRFPSLANSLNHSKLKKRITMMYKSKSSTARRFRALALLPAGALALLATNIPAVASILSEASAAEVTVSTGKVTEIKAETQITATPLKGSVIKVSDKSDNNSSGTTIVTLSSNGRQSDLSDVDVYVNGEKQPTEKLSEINSDKIKSIDIKKGDKDKSTVYITMNSDKASQTTTRSTSITVKNDEPEKKSEKVATAVEQMPQYPGGDRALMEFVAKNVKYPEAAMKAGKEGKVIVRFTVQADGKVADANVIRSISPELDAEAVRVVSTFPAFTPGTVDGKPVACHYVIPISFKLSKDDAAKTAAPEAAK